MKMRASCCAVQESEGEEAADSRVTLEDDLGRGNLAARQSRVKLQEVSISSPPRVPCNSHISLLDCTDEHKCPCWCGCEWRMQFLCTMHLDVGESAAKSCKCQGDAV